MQDVSIELGAPEIYPGQGNEIHIPKQKFFFVREKLHFLFQQCVNADCHLHEGHRTLIVFPKNAPRLTVDQIVKTEAMVSGLKETGNLLLNRLYFEENR
ncbi:MAG: hypothetical protein HOO67_01245 [Candidatus Peribacteraceae bacterium]|nr:hypothetical protein [Candidatus Peribacteraceae bacterium]